MRNTWQTLMAGYRDALSVYAGRGDEVHLQSAYELGRGALNSGLGVLDMVRLHQEALASASGGAAPPALVSNAADSFLLEALSPFEAAHRGFRDACERLRQLNDLLEERNGQLAATNVRLQREMAGRKVAQHAAEESERKYRSVVESARDGIITVSAAGRIVAVNEAGAKMFGYRREDLPGRSFTRLVPPRIRRLARVQLRRFAAGRESSLSKRTRESYGLHRDGTEFPLEISIAAWRAHGGDFITAILRDVRERRQAENALRDSREHYLRLFEKTRAMEESLRQLSNRLLTTQEEERKRISRELHDEIGQTLTAVNVSVALLRRHAQSNPDFARKVERAQKLLEQSMEMVHRFARELRPSMLDHLGPFAAMRNYIAAFQERTGIVVELENGARLDGLDMQQGTVLYRVAQESLTNVFKHAQATRVKVRLSHRANAIVMEIADNGRGMNGSAGSGDLSRPRPHLGIVGMQERVRCIGGRFGIESGSRRGTTVRIEIPNSSQPELAREVSALPTTKPSGSMPTSHEQNHCAAC